MKFHQRTRQLFTFIATIALMSACATSQSPSVATGIEVTKVAVPQMDSLVTAKWLNEHINDPDLVVLDCTVLVEMSEDAGFKNVNGRANYEAGHIPSAGFADLMGELSDPESPLGFGMPTPEQFSAAMGALGVGDDSRVVLYSADYPAWAARVWWMLHWIGFDQVALLDGGLQAWNAEGLPLSTEPATRAAKQLTINLRPEVIADRDEVFAAISDQSVQIVDALPDAHYRGEMIMYQRPGHIPTAVNIPSSDQFQELGRYFSYDELDLMHDGDRNARNITYCGGGISASSNAFVMHRLGFTDVAVYMGSLEEWTADPENPMTTED